MYFSNRSLILAVAIASPLVGRGLWAGDAEKAPTGSDPGERKIEVKLLDSGAEPRRPLRYRFQAGKTETMTMEMRTTMTMVMGDLPPRSMAVPTTRSIMRMEGVEVTPEGNLRYRFRAEKIEIVEEPGVNPLVLQAMKTSLKGMERLKGSGVMSPRGMNLEADVEAPPDASPQTRQFLENFRQSLRNISAPLPEEPIGKGGKWQVVQQIETRVADIRQTAVYKVAEQEGDRVTLEVVLEQSAAEAQPKTGARDEPLQLKNLESKGTGTTRIDLSGLVPRSEVKMTSDSQMEGNPAQGGTKMRLKLNLDVRIFPDEAKAAPEEPKDAPKHEVPPTDPKGKEGAPK